jgi:hypothetical protein
VLGNVMADVRRLADHKFDGDIVLVVAFRQCGSTALGPLDRDAEQDGCPIQKE